MDEIWSGEYAGLILRKGVAVQPGQIVVITASSEFTYFSERMARLAYELGAGEAVVLLDSEEARRLRFLHAPRAGFSDYPDYFIQARLHYLRRGACEVNLLSEDPDLLAGADPHKLRLHERARRRATREYRNYVGTSCARWCTAALPGRGWARKVFPETPGAVQRLWAAILAVSRADCAGAADRWERHVRALGERAAWLTGLRLDQLHFTTSLGTDFTVGLIEDAVWIGGTESAGDGTAFSPNIPTEEVSTAPHRCRAQGRVVASMPLCCEGGIVDGMVLEFRGGLIVDATCSSGAEALEGILSGGDGMRRLGEVALVSADSPIARSGVRFYNTLFDENAACHLAFGSGLPSAVPGGRNNLTASRRRGLNTAGEHVDFMFGTPDLRCVGVRRDGREILLMEDGQFVVEAKPALSALRP